jgi:circadian clock protein KaiB
VKTAPVRRTITAVKKAATSAVKKAAKTAQRSATYVLRLYVAGASPRSQQAIIRARTLCAAQTGDRYELKVIDIYQQPLLAREGQILTTPTLVRKFPLPMRRLIGNLADCAGFFVGLDLTTKDTQAP